MMKITLNKPIKDEKGQALILVLILLLLGGLIITPLLSYMSTGLKVGQMHEARMDELYAADAGVEDALWKIQHDQVPTDPYPLTINGKDVEVTISTSPSITIGFFKLVGALNPHGMGGYNKSNPHSSGEDDWMVVYSPKPSEPGVYYTYEITVKYQGAASTKRIDNIGCWIYGLYRDDKQPADIEEDWGITDDYPIYDSESNTHLGTYFLWEWKGANRPVFGPDEEKTLTFTFSPAVILEEGENFPSNVAWVRAGSDDIFVTWEKELTGMGNIIAVAADPATNKSTTVTSYIFSEEITGEPVAVTILTWEINPQ